MSIDMNLLSVNADALSTNQNDELPEWNVPSQMAFHIVFDGRLDINGKLNPVIRRPYRDTSRPYNQRRDFMAHETRQILDDRMPPGVEYGIVTFEGGSKAAREETRRVVEHLSRGWSDNGKRFRCVYGHAADTGFMLFVDAKSSIHGTDDLGNYAALHLQPRDRIEGLSRGQIRDVTRGTGGSVHPKGRRATPGSQPDPGEASEMQRILRSRTRSLRSHEPACGSGQPSAPDADGFASTAGIATLAPAFRQALPSLADVRTEFSHEANAELDYELCAALVRAGLGTAETWKQCGSNALAFAQHAMMSGIGADQGDLLQRNVEYHLEVSDVLGRAGSDAFLEGGQLAVTVECSGAGYLKIGAAIDALEAEAEGLGAAFYWALTRALYRVMRIYNHDDALMYEERMREYADQDDEESRGQYEFPEVEKALPECIRKTLKRECRDWKVRDRELLHRFSKGSYATWIETLRRIQRLSRLRLKQSRDYIEAGQYDEPPLPAVLVTFKEHDAITACFDEEGQHMMEGTAEPSVCIVFSPRQADEVRHALRIVERFIALNCELFQLVEAIQEWEKQYASPCIDRREPSLRTA